MVRRLLRVLFALSLVLFAASVAVWVRGARGTRDAVSWAAAGGGRWDVRSDGGIQILRAEPWPRHERLAWARGAAVPGNGLFTAGPQVTQLLQQRALMEQDVQRFGGMLGPKHPMVVNTRRRAEGMQPQIVETVQGSAVGAGASDQAGGLEEFRAWGLSVARGPAWAMPPEGDTSAGTALPIPMRIAYVRLSYPLVAVLTGVVPFAAFLAPRAIAWARRRRRGRRGLCLRCGYNLAATPDRCPECGAAAAKAKTETEAVGAVQAP